MTLDEALESSHGGQSSPACRVLAAEVERLRAEFVSLLETVMSSAGCEVHYGEFTGWVDSCGTADALEAGGRLVEMGLWERHPKGLGRRWFYRRKTREETKP